MQRHIPLSAIYSPQYGEKWSDECLVKRASAFLLLGRVDLFIYETSLGGKDNLPSSVITIVHQHRCFGRFELLLCVHVTVKRSVSDVRARSADAHYLLYLKNPYQAIVPGAAFG
jgi:hypothetical protein